MHHFFSCPDHCKALHRNPSVRPDWGCVPVILEPKRLRQWDGEFEASLGYIKRPCLKTKEQTNQYPSINMFLQIPNITSSFQSKIVKLFSHI